MREYFSDIYQKTTAAPVFCYRSGLTVYEEGYAEKRFCPFGWNGAGFPGDILDDLPTYLRPERFPHTEIFSVDVNGISAHCSWVMDGFETETTENGSRHAVLYLHSDRVPLKVEVHTLADGTAILTRWLVLENTADTPTALSSVTVMGGALESVENLPAFLPEEETDRLYSVGYFARSQWGHEGLFHFHPLDNERITVSGAHTRGRHRYPMAIVQNSYNGNIWYIQFGCSGGWAIDFELNTDSRPVIGIANLSFAVRMEGENPTCILASGERFTTPKVHIGMMCADLDTIINEMHTHARRSVFTLPEPHHAESGLIECGIGPERLMDEAYIRHYADTAAEVGAEVLIIDAGWYCPPGKATREWKNRVGDWIPDSQLYPNGLAPIREYIHKKGLLFGLWASIEQMGPLSKLAAQHPDWIIRRMDGQDTILLDLTREDVVCHVEGVFDHLVRDLSIDLFRIDLNISPFDVHFFRENGENGIARYYANLYAMLRRLRLRYPNVIFENCAGGGARCDFGLMENFTHTWVSDYQISPRAIAITNGMTMVLPPERVDRLASGMNSHRQATLDTILRHTLFGRPTTNDYHTIGREPNPYQIGFVRHCCDIYKEVIRPFAATGKIFHHTPEIFTSEPTGYAVLERSAEDRSASVIGVFRLAGSSPDAYTVYPRGLDAGKRYRLTFDNSGSTAEVSGYELQNSGIRVRIASSLSSELLILREI